MPNKTETINAVAAKAGVSKSEAENVLNTFFELVIEETRAGGKVNMTGIGAFSMSERAARMGRNPATGESIQVGPSRSLKFSPASNVKRRMMEGM